MSDPYEYWDAIPALTPPIEAVREMTEAANGNVDEQNLAHYGKLISCLGMALAIESMGEPAYRAPGFFSKDDLEFMRRILATSDYEAPKNMDLEKYFVVQ